MSFVRSLRSYSSHVYHRQSTLHEIQKLYLSNTPISVITAHDFITARIADSCPNLDVVLVGDSLSMVSKGHQSTLELEFDDFYYTTKSVLRGINSKFVIVDLPFGSFESSLEKCVDSSVRLMKLGKIGSIKVEGSYEMTNHIKTLTQFGIPITGHIGLQPQKFNMFGGFKPQGRDAQNALDIYKQALHLQSIGCRMLVLECVPEKISSFITKNLNIPTIGIGAGNGTSGQVLVMSDILGMLDSKNAKFVKQYLNFHKLGTEALTQYSNDVKLRSFPDNNEHTYRINDDEYNEFVDLAMTVKKD